MIVFSTTVISMVQCGQPAVNMLNKNHLCSSFCEFMQSMLQKHFVLYSLVSMQPTAKFYS